MKTSLQEQTMKYPEFVTICITILKEQNDWLDKQQNNKSEVIRFAIKKLMERQIRRVLCEEETDFDETNNSR